MKLIYFLIFFLCLNQSFGQELLAGRIIDSTSKKGVSFAAIVNTTQKNGVYATENGDFVLSINKGDTLKISCIGYKPVERLVKETITKEPLLFYLIPAENKLTDVIIKSINWSNYLERERGYSGTKSNLHVSANTGMEYAVFIPNANTIPGTKIYSLNYRLNKIHLSSVAIRLHLYKANEDNTPGNELLDSNYVEILEGKMDKVISYNISGLQIELPPNGVFVGIEWLGAFDSRSNAIMYKNAVEPNMGFNFKLKSPITYERKHNDMWKISDTRQLFINSPSYQSLESKNIPNASFGITIKVPKKI
ncbi:MAG: carboxypeptidase-like regulatory domain-containing protein [Sediminibacterium sp.]|nr:carboxypeptidase-like regulatory domain-containing protein [Sediminibacterium sp.]